MEQFEVHGKHMQKLQSSHSIPLPTSISLLITVLHWWGTFVTADETILKQPNWWWTKVCSLPKGSLCRVVHLMGFDKRVTCALPLQYPTEDFPCYKISCAPPKGCPSLSLSAHLWKPRIFWPSLSFHLRQNVIELESHSMQPFQLASFTYQFAFKPPVNLFLAYWLIAFSF